MAASGQHSAKTDDHGTPRNLIELERAVMTRIDVDPCSSEKWNLAIGASRIITARENGLLTPWIEGAPRPCDVLSEDALEAEEGFPGLTAHVNPPGDKRGELVAGFYRALTGYFDLGWISSACWVGFSLEQLSRLQRVGAAFSPTSWPTLIPDERVSYMAAPDVVGEQPTHASFMTLLTRSHLEVERFCDLATELGDVVIPYQRKALRP